MHLPTATFTGDEAANFSDSDVRAALAEILASDLFSKAQRMRHLLQFLVECRLAGSVRNTSEYAIGIDVFRRDPAVYTTGTDPIVRVQVGRLREKLRLYYAAQRSPSGLRIALPLGSYFPEIQRLTRAAAPPGRTLALQLLVCITDDPASSAFTGGLNEELSYRLFKEFGHKVMSQGFAVAAAGASMQAASHVVEGSVRVQDQQVRVVLRLIDTQAGGIVWSEQFDRRATLSIALQEELAWTMSSLLSHHLSCA